MSKYLASLRQSRSRFFAQGVKGNFRLAASKICSRIIASLKAQRLRLKDQIVADVPPEVARCEFDCRKTQCRFGEWVNCKNRLSYLAALAAKDSYDAPMTRQ